MTGKGELMYPKGDKLIGQFIDGKFVEGSKQLADGSVYTGELIDG